MEVSNLEIIDGLCDICARLLDLMERQAVALAQAGIGEKEGECFARDAAAINRDVARVDFHLRRLGTEGGQEEGRG